jgi:hypothetical protein
LKGIKGEVGLIFRIFQAETIFHPKRAKRTLETHGEMENPLDLPFQIENIPRKKNHK